MKRALAAVAALTLLPIITVASPAQADTEVVADGFAGPLGLAIGNDGSIYVAEAFGGQLTVINKKGKRSVLATGPLAGGVDAKGKGTIHYTLGVPPEQGGAPDTFLMRVQPNGKTKTVASMYGYEASANPDQTNVYGFVGASQTCLDAAAPFEPAIGPAAYNGLIDSNPYSVLLDDDGTRVVADAGGNSIVRVTSAKQISTVAILPPIPTEFTEAVRTELIAILNEGLPPEEQLPDDALVECVGQTWYGEPVPTDVELGPDGDYYVTSLPGFPELPGTGSVFRIDGTTGDVELVTSGLSGATGLAVAADGTIYVAELFGSQISKIVGGEIVDSVPLDSPAAIEVAKDGTVYATAGVFGPSGSVVVVTF